MLVLAQQRNANISYEIKKICKFERIPLNVRYIHALLMSSSSHQVETGLLEMTAAETMTSDAKSKRIQNVNDLCCKCESDFVCLY